MLLNSGLVFSLDNTTDDVLLRINRIRSEHGLDLLIQDQAARVSADRHAEELAGRKTLSHRSTDGSRVNERYRTAGGTGILTGENLGAGNTVEAIINGWLQSPEHRENLLNPLWSSAGVGRYRMDDGRIILVAVFTTSIFRNTVMQDSGKNGQWLLLTEFAGTGVSGDANPLVLLAGRRYSFEAAESEYPPGVSLRCVIERPQQRPGTRLLPVELAVESSGVVTVRDLVLLQVP